MDLREQVRRARARERERERERERCGRKRKTRAIVSAFFLSFFFTVSLLLDLFLFNGKGLRMDLRLQRRVSVTLSYFVLCFFLLIEQTVSERRE